LFVLTGIAKKSGATHVVNVRMFCFQLSGRLGRQGVLGHYSWSPAVDAQVVKGINMVLIDVCRTVT
jgi:hypothetical protein